MDEIFDKINLDQIFDNDAQLEAVVWYLLFLLGGKVVIPTEPDFWKDNVPDDGDRRIVLRKEEGQLVLVAERLDWQ